jgi:hypothetical protein
LVARVFRQGHKSVTAEKHQKTSFNQSNSSNATGLQERAVLQNKDDPSPKKIKSPDQSSSSNDPFFPSAYYQDPEYAQKLRLTGRKRFSKPKLCDYDSAHHALAPYDQGTAKNRNKWDKARKDNAKREAAKRRQAESDHGSPNDDDMTPEDLAM